MYASEVQDIAAHERERAILDNLPQVRIIARRIHARLPEHVSLEDLISTGILGLISAVDNYEPDRNVKLKTYAEHKIRGAILDSLRDLDWAPRAKRKHARDIEGAIRRASQRLQREPSAEEIAAELKISLDEYYDRLQQIQAMDLESLDYASGEQNGGLLRFLSDSGEPSPEEIIERAELEELLVNGISKMPDIEKTVLSLYYQEELSLREIAHVTQMHLSRVSQLKIQAVLRLRSYIQNRYGVRGHGHLS